MPHFLDPAELRDRLAGEEQQREDEDCTVLDSMLEAQKELQVSQDQQGQGQADPGSGGG